MTRIAWRLANLLAGMLEPHERDAVRGDISESGEPGWQALRGVFGLLVRRQFELWKEWHPWLALFGVVGISGYLLSVVISGFDVALTIWTQGLSNGDESASETLAFLICVSLALFLWSWVSGFVLGSLSGRATWLTGVLFYLVVLNPYVFNPHVHKFQPLVPAFARLMMHGNELFLPHHTPLPLIVMTSLLPLSVGAFLLFTLPAFWGVRVGLRRHSLGIQPTLLLAFMFAILTSLVTWTCGFAANREIVVIGMYFGFHWETSLWPFFALLSWPVGYLIATATKPQRTV